MTVDSESKAVKKKRVLQDDVAYILPMGVFLAFTQLGASFPKLYPASYVAKTLIVPILLWALWRYFPPIRWTHLALGVIVGMIGVVQWVGMEKLLLHLWPDYPRFSVEIYNPFQE